METGSHVHAFVLGLLLQRVDPAAIRFHVAQRTQVPVKGGDNAGNGCDSLEDDGVVIVLLSV